MQGRSGSLGQAFDYRLSLVVPSENLVGSVQIARIRAPPVVKGAAGRSRRVTYGRVSNLRAPGSSRAGERTRAGVVDQHGRCHGARGFSSGSKRSPAAGASSPAPKRSAPYAATSHCAGERSTRPPCPCVTPCPTTLGRSSPALRVVQSMRANHPAAIVGTASGRPFHMYIVLAPPLTRRHRRQWPQ